MRLRQVRFDAAEALGLPGRAPVDLAVGGMTVLLGPNGSGKSRLLELAEGVATPHSPRLTRAARHEAAPPMSIGSVLLELDGLNGDEDGTSGPDWPWFSALLSHLGNDAGPAGLHPELRCAPRAFNPGGPGWEEGYGYVDNYIDEDEYRAMEGPSSPDKLNGDEWWQCSNRIHELIRASHTHDDAQVLATLWTLALAGPKALIEVDLFESGIVRIWWDPDDSLQTALHQTWVSKDLGPLARVAVDALAGPPGPRAIFELGELDRGLHFDQRDVPAPVQVITIGDRVEDPARAVDRWLEAMRAPGERWRDQTPSGAVTAGWVGEALHRLERTAGTVAPPLISHRGRLEVSYEGTDDDQPGATRTLVGIRRPDGRLDEWVRLGAGTRRWVTATVEMAIGQLMQGVHEGAARLLIVDEPELHLHPGAQRGVADWLSTQVDRNTSVLVATHSHTFLDPPLLTPRVYGVLRPTGGLDLVRFGEDLLGTLDPNDDRLAELGLDRSAAAALTRGVLVLEGHDDRRVVQHFFGSALARARVRIAVIHGTENAPGLASAELWGVLGVPLCVMFDSTNDGPRPRTSPEQRKLDTLLEQFGHWETTGLRVEKVAYPLPDIIAALPETAIQRAFPEVDATFSWSETVEAWAGLPPSTKGGFKGFALRQMGLRGKASIDQLVTETLRRCEDDQPAEHLTVAVESAIARLSLG